MKLPHIGHKLRLCAICQKYSYKNIVTNRCQVSNGLAYLAFETFLNKRDRAICPWRSPARTDRDEKLVLERVESGKLPNTNNSRSLRAA